MVNGFFGLALLSKNKKEQAVSVLEVINAANSRQEYSFYENFNTESTKPNGVPFCAWSAAATVFLHQNIYTNFKFFI